MGAGDSDVHDATVRNSWRLREASLYQQIYLSIRSVRGSHVLPPSSTSTKSPRPSSPSISDRVFWQSHNPTSYPFDHPRGKLTGCYSRMDADVQGAGPSMPEFHESFNFEDGTIVLSASGTIRVPTKTVDGPGTEERRRKTMLFKVHKSILRTHSKTFADMLSLPSPIDSHGDTVDGLPVVTLHDDLEDIVKLMKVIYYSDTVPHQPLYQETFDFLVPVLRLADKYDMQKITGTFLPRILEDWPITLAKWDKNEAIVNSLLEYDDTVEPELRRSYHGSSMDEVLVEPCGAIRFGRQYAPNILPAAFYHVSRLDFTNFANDDTGEERVNFLNSNQRSGRYNLLQTEDWVALQMGQASMRAWTMHLATEGYHKVEFLQEPHLISPAQPEPCPSKAEWWSQTMTPLFLREGMKYAPDVLATLKQMADALDVIATRPLCALCHPCVLAVQRSLRKQRAELWSEMPFVFGLKPTSWNVEFEA